MQRLNGTSAGGDHANMTAADRAVFDPLVTSLRGYLLAQITLGLLVALVITSEYGLLVGQTALADADAPHLALSAPRALRTSRSPHLTLSDPRALRGPWAVGSI